MVIMITILHVLVCLALIAIVLLQAGKGADIGAAFGAGSSQTMFGTRGAATFLQKATAIAAVTFMLTSLMLTYVSNRTKSSSVVTPSAAPPNAPAPTGAPSTAPPGAFPNAPVEGEPGLPGTPAPVIPGIPAPGTPTAPAPTTPPGGGAPGNR